MEYNRDYYVGVDWRTFRKLENARVREFTQAVAVERPTHKQQQVIEHVLWEADKRHNRFSNLAHATEVFVHTSNGKTFYSRGTGQARRK